MIALWSWKGHKTRGEVIDIQSTEHNKGDIVCMQLTMDSDKKQPIQETTPDADQNQEEQPPTYEEAVLDDDVKRHMEEWKKVAQERPLRVMVCGLGGVGKSTLINRLLQLEEGEKREGPEEQQCYEIRENHKKWYQGYSYLSVCTSGR
jgi:ribosome biogenesis GTPase A